MTETQVLKEKKFGDVKVVAEIIGESHGNTKQILRRPNAKKHKKAMDVLKRLVESRQQLAEEMNTE